ncbi:hypothetical protein E4P40_18710 [Blastococcus sp. CT_GayMR20]|uniref:hypothetical protein n=1 Tax=Blastococcus sp. CT_GayMR20 TaxID=2559609 RepID=UPI001073619E|nr:hypothetical protein [Blastococcus sp. CT_GayMR20]TFV77716.1 hypothetical protein E4P40_18710 [Blastococcus sp. CT_GayMR20]
MNPVPAPADVRLSLRPPTWLRVWVAVFPLLFVVFLVVVVAPEQGARAWIFAGGFAVTALLGRRLFRLAVLGTADGRLVVRNHWQDHTLRREDIADVTVGQGVGRGGTNRSVRVLLHGGASVPLEVTATSFRPNVPTRLQHQAEAVRTWVSAGAQP